MPAWRTDPRALHGLRRTAYGRKVLAVGGDFEGARRAGIGVPFVRMTVFSTAGALAAVVGRFLAGQIQTASQTSGGGKSADERPRRRHRRGRPVHRPRFRPAGPARYAPVLGSVPSGMNRGCRQRRGPDCVRPMNSRP
ncbi:ABC transporter permease subunit [Streptomyces sp. OR43]|uniref:ABC transporter permease subunit n=1 Tax=Streptomyces sp. or43 TaxID=2478957 RepID=UPI003967375A